MLNDMGVLMEVWFEPSQADSWLCREAPLASEVGCMNTLQIVGFDLKPQEQMLELRWKSGETTRHSYAHLRKHCPCATCRTERDKIDAKGPVLRVISGPVMEVAQLMEVTPVGRYALAFNWNDGHKTGIYTYEFLWESRQHQPPSGPLKKEIS